ncbi:MAG TPA: hypothetical protein VFM01_05045 [Nakamurella sp.]|nr:hypothetical protein [Nakamurella sp.]
MEDHERRVQVTLRFPEDLYREAQRIAAARHETLTAVLVGLLRDWAEEHRGRWGPGSPNP